MKNNTEPKGIYIHIPFCLRKCSYCDFYSVPMFDPVILENYTRSLIAEIQLRKGETAGPVGSLYFGGGTPSLLPPEQVERIIETIGAQCSLTDGVEITLEVNPATIDATGLRDLRAAGVNRLSVGVQSFADRDLQILGRKHQAGQAVAVLHEAQQAGFAKLNIDLIYGVPGQTMEAWQQNLGRALEFDPTHISAYLLQLDPSVPLARRIERGEVRMLEQEMEADLYDLARDYLQRKGFRHYEISNFARPGQECRHNLLYWQSGYYCGLGAGAVSFDGWRRTINKPDLDQYIQCLQDGRLPPQEILEHMTAQQRWADAMITGLRLSEGVNREGFRHRFGIDIMREYSHIIGPCLDQGLLEFDHDYLRLNPSAFFLSNQVLSQFVG